MKKIILLFTLLLTACARATTTPTQIPATKTPTSTQTPAPTETPTQTATPEPPTNPSVENIKIGRWGEYTFTYNPSGYYETKDAQGNIVPDVKFFEDGTAELSYGEKDLVVADQVITLEKGGGLIVGLWEYKDGQWGMETYKAPNSEEETKNWRTLAIIKGHEKEQAMINTIFLARDVAMVKSETFDPADEFKNISITVNFKTFDNFDVRPKNWEYHRHGYGDGKINPNWVGVFSFEPNSRSNEVVYENGSTLEYARPIQASLNIGWFNIEIYGKDGNSQPAIIHVPTVAMNSDGSLVFLSTIMRQGDVHRIKPLLTKDDRGKLWFYLCSIPIKSNYILADQQLIAFTVDVNRSYFELPFSQLVQVPPEVGYGWYPVKFKALPKELAMAFFVLIVKSEYLAK